MGGCGAAASSAIKALTKWLAAQRAGSQLVAGAQAVECRSRCIVGCPLPHLFFMVCCFGILKAAVARVSTSSSSEEAGTRGPDFALLESEPKYSWS